MADKDAFNPDNYLLSSSYDVNARTLSENVYSLSEKLRSMHRFYAENTGDRAYLWVYDKQTGVWTPEGEDLVRYLLRDAITTDYKTHITSEVIASLKAAVYDTSIDIYKGGPSDKIVVKNGVLNLTSGELTPFNPEEYHITKIPVTYDPEATCPNFSKFLDQVTGNNNDRLALEEIIGYGLYTQYTHEIIVFLVGEGANGKSVYLSVLRAFFGADNVTAITPQQLINRPFTQGQLFGKLVNLAGDINQEAFKYAGPLKLLTGGDTITAERKFRDPIHFVNYAKLIFSGNQLPPSYDTTNAFYRRMNVIPFPNIFNPSDEGFIKRDDLLALLTTEQELSGILNLALAGWQRLNAQGQLSGALSTEEKRLAYQKESDPALYFCERYLYPSTESGPIPKSVLYDCYVRYCRDNNKVPIADSTFAQKIIRFVPYAETRKILKVYSWVGMGLNYGQYDIDTLQQGVIE